MGASYVSTASKATRYSFFKSQKTEGLKSPTFRKSAASVVSIAKTDNDASSVSSKKQIPPISPTKKKSQKRILFENHSLLKH